MSEWESRKVAKEFRLGWGGGGRREWVVREEGRRECVH